MKFTEKIKNHTFKLILLEFTKWKIIDFYRIFKTKKRKIHLYGVRCIVGMYGSGKTMYMSYLAHQYREKYGNDIYIMSNFGLSIEDFKFCSKEDILQNYDKPIIILFDELQNSFPSSNRDFDKEVLKVLTLNRKGNGKMIFWASQDHELVAKPFRRLTIEYALVKTLFDRFTRARWYLANDYQLLFEENNFDKKMKIKPFKTQKFVQTDILRNSYDSFSLDNSEEIKK